MRGLISETEIYALAVGRVISYEIIKCRALITNSFAVT